MCKNSFTDYYDYYRFEQSFGYVSTEPTSSVFCHSYFSIYHRWSSISLIICSLWTVIKNCIIFPQTRSEFWSKPQVTTIKKNKSSQKFLLKTTRNRHNTLYVKENVLYSGRGFWSLL